MPDSESGLLPLASTTSRAAGPMSIALATPLPTDRFASVLSEPSPLVPLITLALEIWA